MKKVLIFIIFFSFSCFVSPFPVFSQQQSEHWVCLKIDRGVITPGNELVKLRADDKAKPLPNSDTYILECISTDHGQICTTGKSALDQIVYKQDNTALLNGAFKFISSIPHNPVKSDAVGEIGTVEWNANHELHNGMHSKYLALNYFTPSPTAAVGSGGALHQQTFGFDFLNTAKNCLIVAWDPFGRVFDSQSLEPVMGATVTLLMKRAGGNFTPVTTNDMLGGNIINPQTLAEDGGFSFVVPDATYKLIVAGSNYTFPITNLTALHSNYTKIYSEIYPAATGEEIVQAGSIQHRDIPVKSLGQPTNNPPKLMSYFYNTEPINQKIVIEGKVSHPFTNVTFWSYIPTETDSEAQGKQLLQLQADKKGEFKAEIDQSVFDKEKGEYFGQLVLTKTDLTQLANKSGFFGKVLSMVGSLFKRVEAQTQQSTTVKFDPIPTYLEGYAYDASGQILPNAQVGVYLSFSNKPYYQTTTDEKGYFKITSENLPTMPYGLRYTTVTGSLVKATTGNFISQNKKYLAENKTNPFVFKNQQGKEITKADISPTVNPVNTTTSPVKQTPANGLILIGDLIFILVIVIIILITLFIKRKQPESPPTAPGLS